MLSAALLFRNTYDATCGDDGFPSSEVVRRAGLVGPGVLITRIRVRQPKCWDRDHWVPKVVRAALDEQNRQLLVGFRKSAGDNAPSSTSYIQSSAAQMERDCEAATNLQQ